jgi:hypothetical protein
MIGRVAFTEEQITLAELAQVGHRGNPPAILFGEPAEDGGPSQRLVEHMTPIIATVGRSRYAQRREVRDS